MNKFDKIFMIIIDKIIYFINLIPISLCCKDMEFERLFIRW